MDRLGRCFISKTLTFVNSSNTLNKALYRAALFTRANSYPSFLSPTGNFHAVWNNAQPRCYNFNDFAYSNVVFLQQQRSIRKYLPSANYFSTIKTKLKNSNILRRTYSDEKLKTSENEPTSEKAGPTADTITEEDQSKMTLIQKFKFLWKKYWYIVIPVHFCTSWMWFGAFYYLSVCGVDLIGFLETIGTPDKILHWLKEYPIGAHFVLAGAIYKLIMPLRYMTTIGLTHYAMKFLSKKGWIKPAPGPTEIMRRTSHFKKTLEEKRRLRKEILKQKVHKNGHSNHSQKPKDEHKP